MVGSRVVVVIAVAAGSVRRKVHCIQVTSFPKIASEVIGYETSNADGASAGVTKGLR
jgi:hypothetical protein